MLVWSSSFNSCIPINNTFTYKIISYQNNLIYIEISGLNKKKNQTYHLENMFEKFVYFEIINDSPLWSYNFVEENNHRSKINIFIEPSLINDFLDKVKIYDAGHIFTPDESGNYHIKGVNETSHFMTFDNMLNAKSEDDLLFEPISNESLNLVVEEMPINSDDEVKKWRIQLDVNTSLNKLKEIKKFLEENIPDLL